MATNRINPPGIVVKAEAQKLSEWRKLINDQHQQVQSHLGKALERAKVAGETLVKVKHAAPPDGFHKWIEKNLDFSRATASRYMKIAQRWEEVEKFITDSMTVTSALKLLAEKESDDQESKTPSDVYVASVQRSDPGVSEIQPSTSGVAHDAETVVETPLATPSPAPDEAESSSQTEQEKTAKPEAPACDSSAGQRRDEVGLAVPESLLKAFAAQDRFDELMKALRSAQKIIHDLAVSPGGERLRENLTHKQTGEDKPMRHSCEHIANAITKLRFARPYAAVCPYCHHEGKVDAACNACRGLGWVTESTWKHCPADYVEATVADCKEAEA